MAENTQKTDSVVIDPAPEVAPTRLQVFVNNHPRMSRVVAVTGAGLAVLGVVQTTKTLKANKSHLNEAANHATEAFNEISASVTPQDADA